MFVERQMAPLLECLGVMPWTGRFLCSTAAHIGRREAVGRLALVRMAVPPITKFTKLPTQCQGRGKCDNSGSRSGARNPSCR